MKRDLEPETVAIERQRGGDVPDDEERRDAGDVCWDALGLAREALIARRKLELSYATSDGVATTRTVRPLGIFFWGRTWTLAAWCELRQDFRNFRLDRVAASTMLDETFEDESGKALRDMLARYGPEAVRLIDS